MQAGGDGDQERQKERPIRSHAALGGEGGLFSLWASMPEMSLDFGDVVRAYFHARARGKVYVELPEEDWEEGMCGRLELSMYGTRDAAQNWEEERAEMLIGLGFKQGKYTPCAFYHPERD